MHFPFIRSFFISIRGNFLVLPSLCLLSSCQAPNTHHDPLAEMSLEPKILGQGIISTSEFHESINTISRTKDTLYFSRADKGFEQSTLLVSSFVDGKWDTPDTLPFSGDYYDAGLDFSPDQTIAFFTSKRAPNKKGLSKAWNIWKVQLKSHSWGKPEVLEFPINSDSLECCFTMNEQGEAYFASNRSGSWDIYYTKYTGQSFEKITKVSNIINTLAGEWPSYIDRTGNLLIFSSIRKEGLGGDDLYLSRKNARTWSELRLLAAPINSPSYEDSPLLTEDGQVLLFSSWRETSFSKGVSNIYFAKWFLGAEHED